MFFLNPAYLWAFLGLIIPIAIHLWSKKEGKTIKIGSIQLLTTADTKKSSSIKLNEFWLLLLRLFLLSVLVLIISNLNIRKKVDTSSITYIVEPSLLQNKEFKSILDTISTDVSVRLLQKGFPEIDLDENHKADTTIPNYWQLAEDMTSLPSDSIIVFTNAYQSGFKGMRPSITKRIEWIPITFDKTGEHLLEANQLDEQLELLVMTTSDEQVSFNTDVLKPDNTKIKLNASKDSIFYLENWTPINTEKTNQVLLFYDVDFSSEAKYLEASFTVVSKYLNRKIDLVKTNDLESINAASFDIVIWLSKKPIPNTNAKVLVFESNPSSNQLIEESAIKGVYHLTKLLDFEIIEKNHLPEELIPLLDLNPSLEKQMSQYDKRVMAKKAFVPTYRNSKLAPRNDDYLDLSKWLWALFILLLIAERITSYYRTQ